MVCGLLGTGTLLLPYPLMLCTGWLRHQVRRRDHTSFRALWQQHGRVGLHRFGWAEAALDAEYAPLASCLIVLAGAGVCALLYSLGKQGFL